MSIESGSNQVLKIGLPSSFLPPKPILGSKKLDITRQIVQYTQVSALNVNIKEEKRYVMEAGYVIV